MSWNRPSENGSEKKVEKTGRGGQRNTGLLMGGVVLAIAAGGAWWLLTSGSGRETKQDTEAKRGLIKEVTPAAAPKAMEERVAPKEPKKKHYWEQDTTNGLNAAQIRKWQFVRRPKPTITNNVAASHPKMRCEIFDTYPENEIAVLMTLEPGQGIAGLPSYSKSYEEEFLKSCETPIIITAEDDDYTRQLKKDMIAVKIDIRARMAKGEKLGDIMIETRKEAMRLNQLKQQILDETRALVDENGASGEDAQVYYDAANKLLEKNGIAPIKRSALSARSLMRRVKNGGKYK